MSDQSLLAHFCIIIKSTLDLCFLSITLVKYYMIINQALVLLVLSFS